MLIDQDKKEKGLEFTKPSIITEAVPAGEKGGESRRMTLTGFKSEMTSTSFNNSQRISPRLSRLTKQ
jgi:hypothetical protein